MPAMWLRYPYCTEVNGSPGPAGGEFLTWPMNSNARLSSCQKFPEERSCAKPPRLTIQQSVNTGRAHEYCFARIQSLPSPWSCSRSFIKELLCNGAVRGTHGRIGKAWIYS